MHFSNLDIQHAEATLRNKQLAPSIKGFSLAVLQYTLSFPEHVGVIETGPTSCKCAEGGLAEPRARATDSQELNTSCLMAVAVKVKELLRK
jgi:hypothetical protein